MFGHRSFYQSPSEDLWQGHYAFLGGFQLVCEGWKPGLQTQGLDLGLDKEVPSKQHTLLYHESSHLGFSTHQ